MGRRAKPPKGKAKTKRPLARKSPKDDSARVRDLEKRLAEALGQLQTRNRQLVEAHEQQTAMAEILRVISSSPTDLQPVLDAVSENASRLCEASDAVILLVEGTQLTAAAHHGEAFAAAVDRPVTRDGVAGRAVIDRASIHLPDVQAADDFPLAQRLSRADGSRTVLATPLIQEAVAVGAILIRREEVRPFSDQQIALLKTFADQAVIAIENVRLFTELQARNRELTEALEQRAATSEILGVIATSPTDAQPVFDAIARNAVALCGGIAAVVLRFDGEVLHVAGHHNVDSRGVERLERRFPRRPARDYPPGWAFLNRTVVHVPDLQAAAEFAGSTARESGRGSFLAVPLLREQEALGVIGLSRDFVGPFSPRQIEVLQTFADQAVIAIENVRLFNETKEALDRQTATAEILRVISSSPTDVQPVFDAIAESSARLCNAFNGSVFQFDGALIHFVAHTGIVPAAALEVMQRLFPARPSQGNATVRAILRRAVVHIPDVHEDPEYRTHQWASELGIRSVLSVPMLREGRPIGTITVNRVEAGPFSDTHVELLKTFADQAVIAIENVRLFKELEARNAELTETLARQTATGEVLRAISNAQTDAQPVFEIIAASALRLCSAGYSGVTLYDGEMLHLAALHNFDPVGAEAVRNRYPRRADESQASGSAVRTRSIVQIPDVLEDPDYGFKSEHESAGFRSTVAVPMLREGEPIGTIFLGRAEPRAFSDKQIALLQTFADQAVIAIENVRLFKELEARNRDLTATSEILRVIASSPTDVQPVFDAVAASAARLCEAFDAVIFRRDGDRLVLAAHHGPILIGPIGEFTIPLVRGSVNGRSVLDGRTVHVADLQVTGDEFPEGREFARRLGFRTTLAVPLIREGVAIGTIHLRRTEAQLFTERQVALLQTFADQAVIAIENVRLFTELEARNAALTESLDQQTATSEILRVISQSQTEVQSVFNAIVRNAVRLCDATFGAVYLCEAQMISLAANHYFGADGPQWIELVERTFPTPLNEETVIGQAVITGRILRIADVEADPTIPPKSRQLFQSLRMHSSLIVPMHREAQTIGAIIVSRREVNVFTDAHVELIKTFADQAVIAIENVRLFKELEARNSELTQALEQQTATSEILRVISQSPTDVQPVFDTLLRNAVRLCNAVNASLYRFDGQLIHLVANHNLPPPLLGPWQQRFPRTLSEGGRLSEVLTTGAVMRIADVFSGEGTWSEASLDALRGMDAHSALFVPMFRQGQAIGVIALFHREVGAFTDQHVALLHTFADQAVIAIENVRLFKELEARTRDLTRSVEQLTALGEVGQAVSSTLDLDAVLSAIVSRAVQLSSTDTGSIWEYDEATEEFTLRATQNADREFTDLLRETRVRRGEGVVGRLAETREPIQVPDVTVAGAYAGRLREAIVRSGQRASLGVPLLREDHIVGGLVVTRRTPGEFPAEVVEVLKTFATQSAIAIQNARLFRELEAKSRELEVASRHKSEFLANVSHELRTPMNAILGFNELIVDGIYGEVPPEVKVPLTDIQNSGKHLLRLINNVLDLSKIEAGRMELTLTDYLVQDTVDRVRATLSSLAAQKGLGFVAAVPADLPLARGDAGRITQCLMNLAGNALKFTREGRVEIAVDLRGDVLQYRVTDTGIGIAKDQLETVFGEFRQGDPTITREFGGTGLGLSITKKFVEMHGGRIWVESERTRHGVDLFLYDPAARGACEAGMSAKTILYVEDNELNRKIVRDLLRRTSYRLLEAPDGEAGIAMALEQCPDLILMDVQLPKVSGIDAMRALRQAPGTADTPIIAITSFALSGDEQRAKDAGATAYLAKPYSPRDLLKMIRRLAPEG